MKKMISVVSAVFILLLSIFVIDYNTTGYIKNALFTPVEDEVQTVKILATGDIMYHLPLYIKNFDETTGKYDFSTYYEKMKEYIDSSDIVVGNFESTINPNRKISGHPMFNSPPESVEYLKNIGFDILSTANNHCLDTSIEGVETTIDAIESVGLKNFGTYRDNNRELLIIEENEIKIGFLSYSEIFNGLDYNIAEDKVNNISPMNRDLISGDIDNLKAQGVDFIVVYPHWGVEYSTSPSEFQRDMNDYFLSLGADVVLGSHPHVLQPVEYREINGSNKFSIYSMGNSISNQRKPWMKNKGVEFGTFVELTVEKNITKGTTVLAAVDVKPTYVNRYRDEKGLFKYEVVALNDLMETGKYRDEIDDSTKKFVDENYQWVMDVLNNREAK